MGSSLSNLFDNLSEETIKLYVNIDTMIKNVKIAKLNISITTVNTQYSNLKKMKQMFMLWPNLSAKVSWKGKGTIF